MVKMSAGMKVGAILSLGFVMAGAAQPEGCGGEPEQGLFGNNETRYVMSKDVHGFEGLKIVGWGEASLVDNGAGGYLSDARWYLWETEAMFADHPGKPDCVVYEGPQALPGVESAFPDMSFETCEGCMAYYAETIEAPFYGDTCSKVIMDQWGSDPVTGQPILTTQALTGYRDALEAGFPDAWADDIKWLEQEGAVGALYYARFGEGGSFEPEFVVF